jgi:hypothetical protein
MDSSKLQEVLDNHAKWLKDDGGERADLSSADLSSANLRFANLSSADLSSADLSSADLSSADLSSANLSSADLSSANLRSADLSSADLRSADLRSANLRFAVGNMKEIKSLFLENYPITYTYNYLQIGCERHEISEWWVFDDKAILNMDGKTALKFWRKWKSYIQQTIELSPAAQHVESKEDAA